MTVASYLVSYEQHEYDRDRMFADILATGTFADVTFVCDDGQLQAHKVVLSAASPFFKSIFEEHSASHRVLKICGSTTKTLIDMLEFLYSGETSVYSEDYDAFLTFAKDFQIEALVTIADVDEEKNKLVEENRVVAKNEEASLLLEDNSDNSVSDTKQEKASLTFAKDFQIEALVTNADEENDKLVDENRVVAENEEPYLLLEEDSDNSVSDAKQEKANAESSLETFENQSDIKLESMGDLDEKIASLHFKNEYNQWACKLCNYASRYRNHVKEHVETHLNNFSHTCKLCAKVFKTRSSLRSHRYVCSVSMKIEVSGPEQDCPNKPSSVGQMSQNNVLTGFEGKVQSLLIRIDAGRWACKVCDYKSAKSHVKEHVEEHIDGYSHSCPTCEKVFRKRRHLRQHKKTCVNKIY